MRTPTNTPVPAGGSAGERALAAYLSSLSPQDQAVYTAASAPRAKTPAMANPVPWKGPHGHRSTHVLRDADAVSAEALKMPAAQATKLAGQMQAVGLLDEGPVTRVDFEKAWDHLVGLALRWHGANPKSMLTPYDMLDLYYGDGGSHQDGAKVPGPFSGHGVASKVPKASKVVTRELTLATNDDARSLLGNMLTRELGRRPSAKEVDNFQAALNEAQTKNPFVTTQATGRAGLGPRGESQDTQTFDQNGKPMGSATSTTKTGGVDPQQFADRYFQQHYQEGGLDSEYGAYQAATTYMSALMQALKGTA